MAAALWKTFFWRSPGHDAPLMLALLLRHEIRLGLRLGTGAARGRWLAGLVLIAALPVALGWFGAQSLAAAPDKPSPAAMSLLVGAHLFMLPLMASLAAVQVLRAFHDRNDLDLLLAAPVPPREVFLAKALSVCWMVAMPFVLMLGPFVLFSMLRGHWGWGGTLIVLLSSATIATGLGFLIVAALIRWLGARRARVAVHLGSAALGASIFIVSQVSALGGGFSGGREGLLANLSALTPPPPFDSAARAMVGEPLPLLAFCGLALLALLGAAGPGAVQLARRQNEVETLPTKSPAQLFTASPVAAILDKELSLLWRDPETLAQVLLRFIYLVPLVLLALQENASPETTAARLLSGGVALAAMAASSLAWITLCAEEAPELVEAAPISPWQRNSTKLALACLLPLIALLPLGLWLLTLDPVAALMLLPLGLLAGASMAAVQGWHGPRLPRTSFRKRPRAMLLMGVVEVAMAIAWAVAASFFYRQHPAMPLPFIIIAFIMLLAWVSRSQYLIAPRFRSPRSA